MALTSHVFAPDSLAQPDILVAEDDPDLAGLLQLVLEEEGYRVTAVGSGQAVLDAVWQHPPDLLLLDVCLGPGLSGWDVLRRLDTAQRPVPTVMVTGDATTGPIRRSGMAAILAKPFDLDELLAVVERHRAAHN